MSCWPDPSLVLGYINGSSSHFFKLEWKAGYYFTGQDVKADCILPYSKPFKPSIDIFTIHDLFTRLPRLFM